MKITIAKTAGFCMGVRRAVDMVLSTPNRQNGPIHTYGPLIHNPQVLSLLEDKKITVLDKIPEKGNGTVLIRAHGVPPEDREKLVAAGFSVIDATCPRVIKVQSIIAKYAKQGYVSIIIGDIDHPEVIGLLGFSEGKGIVIDSLEAFKSLPEYENAIVVAQTTQDTALLDSIQAWVNIHYPHYIAFNTICDSTKKRQEEVSLLARSVDAVIVVGGKDSGNTRRLAQIAAHCNKPTYHIESASELDLDQLRQFEKIGVTAGASTPNWVIKSIINALEQLIFKTTQGWSSMFFSLQRNLLLTNIYVSLGAGSLGYACTTLLETTYYKYHALIAVLYVQSMHIFNHLIGSKADQFNEPDRAAFYERYKILLAALAIVAGAAGLLTAYTLGIHSFLTLLIMSLLGLSYNLRLVPQWFGVVRLARIRDIPGSKTILIAVAWGVVTTILPLLSSSKTFGIPAIIVFIWSTGMVFVRTAFFDILDIQGDRIVGKDTLPILIGEKRTMMSLKILLLLISSILAVSSAFHLIPHLGFSLAVCPLLMGLVLTTYEKGYILPFIRLEFLIETHFILAGVLAFVWYLF